MMQNMMMIDDSHMQTAYGIFGDVSSYEVYDTGELKSVILSGKNMVLTHAGELVPFYSETERRKYKPAVEFYRSGMIKTVSLEEQQELETPIGEFPAELVTFFETGEINRVFPLDGKISGFRSEEDERSLNIPFSFELDFCKFTAMLNSVCFYQSGNIRSITLFPKEKVTVQTKYGDIHVRNGFSLYESGALASCEPVLPSQVITPIGKILAYDVDAAGLSADSNSLCFYENGDVKSLITVSNRVAVQTEDERFITYEPKIIPAVTEEESDKVCGLKIVFHEDGVSFHDEEKIYSYCSCGFTPMSFGAGVTTCSPSDCANCSLCKE